MCRFTLYLGPPIRLASLLIEPSHSLIQQSYRAAERLEPLNGDGFGVGWYAADVDDEPAVFRSVTPAWNNQNLHSLAKVVSSHCVMAHVRAATGGMAVNEANTHPFQHGRFLFMHNGLVGSFTAVRRSLLASLGDDAFDVVRGSTDTEHVFAVFVDEILKAGDPDQGAWMAENLNRAVWRVVDLAERAGNGAPSTLNLAVTDGDRAVACRFRYGDDERPESLYFIEHELYEPVAKDQPGRRRHESSRSFVVSSERLTEEHDWNAVPRNHMVSIRRNGLCRMFGMERGGLRAEDEWCVQRAAVAEHAVRPESGEPHRS